MDETIFENIKTKYAGELGRDEEMIYKSYDYSDQFVNDWMEIFKDDKTIKDHIDKM